ncbi:Pentatricopeptide repeat-containing protein [Platanthera guangdongensis]|uniref:Pentatricopeptide repeat-containing protein n=1 Tax=Platanthera guangdongensis TaxID=2320717 RepID=A0ABR2MWP4_9ASPA
MPVRRPGAPVWPRRASARVWSPSWLLSRFLAFCTAGLAGLTFAPLVDMLQESRSVGFSWLNPSSFQSSSSLVLRIEAPRCTIDKPPRSHSKSRKKEHHLWMKRDSAGSGQKALHLVRLVSKLPYDKDAVTAALDYWTAWETEFPVIASAKALEILRRRNQWQRIIQVSKWLLSKGQVLTMGTYDTLLLALDRDGRLEEAEELWPMILQTNTRSVSKRLFSRMVSIYDRRRVSEKVVEVFADMEELGVRPDDDTVRRVASAFANLGEFENQKLVLRKYQNKWKYLSFNGERGFFSWKKMTNKIAIAIAG